MKSVTIPSGGRATRVPACTACGDLVRCGRDGGRCQNPRCRTWYPDSDIEAAVAEPIDLADPVVRSLYGEPVVEP